MKTFVMLLTALLLLLEAFSPAETGPIGAGTSPCCTKHTSRKIPINRVKGFSITSSRCQLPSVMFLLTNDKIICADPEEDWVQEITTALKN